MRPLLALAALFIAAGAVHAQPYVVAEPVYVAEARWCTAQAVFIDVQWDCRYPTRAICQAYAPHDRLCLENPNWNLMRGHRR